jgi:hypothetical protein
MGGKMKIHFFRNSPSRYTKKWIRCQLLRNSELILFVIVFELFTLFVNGECYSQNEKPEVLVTVIFAKETEACAPNGYASNYDTQSRQKKCNPLYYDKLSELGITVAHKLPPDKIPLKELFRLVNWYSDKCTLKAPCKDPEDRYSIILAFEFQMKDTKGIEVSLKRRVPEDLKSDFEADSDLGNYSAEGMLDEGGHWINHQRADLFLPGYGVKWILKAGEYSWTLLTTK